MKDILPILAGFTLAWLALCPNAAAQVQLGARTPSLNTDSREAPLPAGGVSQARPPQRATQPAAPPELPLAEALIHRAVATMDAHRSISAKVRHRVDLLGHPLVGTGSYLQQGRGEARTLRLELTFQSELQSSGLLQVSDGSNFWSCEEFDGEKILHWVDLARLRRARPKGEPTAQSTTALFALGGLPKLLANLESSFRFGRVAESQLDELRVWSVEGHWKPAKLIEMLPDKKEAIEKGEQVDLSSLSPNLPDRIVLHFGCEDLFPYRIEYWRSDAETDANRGQSRRLIVVMEMYEVQFGARIDSAQFLYQPGTTTRIDRTKEMLERFGLEDAPPEAANRRPYPARRR